MSDQNNDKQKLLVICGPTSVGKSELAVALAKEFSGEVISTDSRQVYEGLDIGAGTITHKEMQGVPHHLLNVADPRERFSVDDFKQLGDQRVHEIHKQDKLPILCGGSGFYIQAVVDDLAFPDVPPNDELREQLKQRSAESLYQELEQKDPRRAETIDENNPVRLIRALEIVEELGKVPKLEKHQRFDTLQIGLERPDKELKQRIIKRTKKRFDRGMIAEAETLRTEGVTLERMRDLGLVYKHLANFLDNKLTKQELFDAIVKADWQYVKKQRTWFQKDDRIVWFHPEQDKHKIIEKVGAFAAK